MMNDTLPAGGGFGSRLRKLVDRLDREVLALYREAGVGFEPRWYAVFTTLLSDGPATVGDLAQRLGVTHAAVSQVRSALQAEGLITTRPDSQDGRRAVMTVSPKGVALAERLTPLWRAINEATDRMLSGEAPGLLAGLDDLSEALDRRPMADRIAHILNAKAPA